MTAPTSFWARRKAGVAAEQEAEARAAAVAKEEARAAALSEKSDDEIREELGLPEPEHMKEGDDFAAFLSREVPEHLRRKALRTLWRSNPVLACVDGLNDYDDDYRIASVGAEAVKTAYQIGKGMTYHLEELARQAEAVPSQDDAAEEVSPVVDVQKDAFSPETAQAFSDETPETQGADTSGEQDENIDGSDDLPRPRRMRFHFEEKTA